jgi:hypothetical protein
VKLRFQHSAQRQQLAVLILISNIGATKKSGWPAARQPVNHCFLHQLTTSETVPPEADTA